MKLTSLLDRDHIFVHLDARSKRDAFDAILRGIEAQGALRGADGKSLARGKVLAELMEREAKGNTALGDGIGYPHIRTPEIGDFLIALALLEHGIDYGATDGQPVDLLVMAVVPPEKNSLLLGVVAAISGIMADPLLLAALRDAEDSHDAWERLEEAGLDVKESVTAEDIMKRQFVSVTPEMSLGDVAGVMHRERLDVLPVIDAEGRLVGDVSASGLFASTMPRYFAEIPSMKFLRDFDGFEHFFREKAALPVSRILNERPPKLKSDAPLAEIIARLARPEVAKLYVIANGRLVGVIDNFSLIDKVLSI